MKDSLVIIAGAGPSGIATSACLNRLSLPNIVIEREDCFASLWKKKTYDRVHLHLAKQFCQLPHMSFPDESPTYVPRQEFLKYLDDYVEHFNVKPIYNRSVESASFDEVDGKWHVQAKNHSTDKVEAYKAKFLVVATGETSDVFIPRVEGLENFKGEVLHSTKYKSGHAYSNKSALVVGCGNSGMEIALDLSNFGAKTSIVVRNAVHMLNREMINMGLMMLRHLPRRLVDGVVVFLSRLVYGDMSKYGIDRPEKGPFVLKEEHGKYIVIDVGTFKKIKSGEIQVFPSIKMVKHDCGEFRNGKIQQFDVIIFATGFKRSTSKWLKDGNVFLNEDGIPKTSFPNHWKGLHGIYCAGLSRRGIYGAALDAQNIANDIKSLI